MVDNGEKILKVSVDCMYPKDDSFPDEDVDNVSVLCTSTYGLFTVID